MKLTMTDKYVIVYQMNFPVVAGGLMLLLPRLQ